ncbi:cytochrome P450 [Oscillatoria sp. FACHB-1407]|uniref:cytochrome P450 n=1 Tax=Oscillatoria sp. FACHB-1407 TaxID=2692847 RepID=UPI00168533B2|nr:cytochrome P450 [Oscillatoria sp. FACHB-1407]MBD2465080.1 cytochrome P450 [Oscillatoria sp. FACHB-1407]
MTLPDGPKAPYWLRGIRLIVQPLQYLEGYQRRYGDLFMVRGASTSVVYLNHPSAIQTVFSAAPEHFSSGTGGQVLKFLLGDSSVIIVDGDRHQRQRRLLLPPFHGDRLKTYSQLICDVAQQVTTHWQIGKPFRVRPVMQEITLRIILKAVFGLSEGDRFDQLRQQLSALLDSLGSPLSASLIFFPILRQDWGAWSPWGRFVRLKEQVDHLIYAEIRDRQQRPDPTRNDILTLLMSARDDTGQPLTEQELRDELITLLLAGHETTASALSWAFYWVHKLPTVQDKLRSELDRLGNCAEPEEIARSPYLTAVCQETLRIYPVTLTTGVRVLQSPLEVMGYHLEAGMVLFPCTYLVHQREDLYPNPQEFKPERFLQRQFAPYEYLPFGGGNRYCIGAAFAMLEMKLVLATILRDWQLALPSSQPVKPVRRGLTLAPQGHLKLVATAR